MVAWRQTVLRTLRNGVRAVLRGPDGQRADARHHVSEFAGAVRIDYSPSDNGSADPGEVVWTWVPFEENDGRGKDRPVLVIGRAEGRLVALMLTSKDHDRDAAVERRHGRIWLDVGTGAWDSRRRPSEVRLDRVLLVDPQGVRREGARLDRARFEEVAGELRRLHGWS